ncbi:hypothetical protein Bbelb_256460 [Branchiostoma belcheri]|nr:hypothetical protein Bbelb_256460 [Branchiostoma belcheri]
MGQTWAPFDCTVNSPTRSLCSSPTGMTDGPRDCTVLYYTVKNARDEHGISPAAVLRHRDHLRLAGDCRARSFACLVIDLHVQANDLQAIKIDPCRVNPTEREECGWPGISQETCRQKGCCFDSSIRDTKWCFFKKGCPKAGYVYFSGNCFKLFAESQAYSEAKQTCAADGAVLAMPRDNVTNSFLAGMGSGEKWIGISDSQIEGQWVFADGQTLQSAGYSNWNPACRISDSYVHVRGTCYKYFAETKTYDEAKQTCAADGAILAMPKDNVTNSFLAGMGTDGRWIGISDSQMEGQWVFADGQTLQSAVYSNWAPACRISDSYVHVRGTCYKYFAETKTYYEAQQTCAADGAILAMPKDNVTNSFLAGMGGGAKWIGIHDAQMEGQWVFLDSETLQSAVYSNWAQGEPNNDGSGEDCGEMRSNGLWNDMPCNDYMPFLCQLLPAPPVAVWPLDAKYGASDATGNGNDGTATGTQLAPGPYGNADGAFLFWGTSNSYVHIPNDGQLDVQYSYTILAHIYPTGQAGPIFHYERGADLWHTSIFYLVMWPHGRDGQPAPTIQSGVLKQNAWNFVGGTYDNTTGVGSLWENGERVQQRQVGFSSVATQYDVWVAWKEGDSRIFKGRIACLQLYDYVLTRDQILAARNMCRDECATDSGGCDQICSDLLGSYTCSCRQGFVLMTDGHGCEDINECATDRGGCEQICTNFLGSYNCSCQQGFVLMEEDGHSCKVCGHCQGGDVNCDQISGVCSAGCKVGWKTQRCTQAVDPPVNLAVTDVTEGGFNVTWSPSRDPDLQGYRVVVLRLDLTTAVNHSTDRASCTVAGLSSETDYVIEVTSLVLSEGRRSQSEEAIMRAATGARSSTDLQFVEVTDFMLVFTWVPPDSAVTGYRIMYGQEEATERLIPSPGPGARSAVITGLQPDTMYKVAITTIGVYRESLPLVGQSRTAPVPTTSSPATTTRRTSRMTTVLSTSPSSSSTPAKTSESAGDQISSDEDDAGIDNDYYYDSEPEPPIPTTESIKAATTASSSKSPDDVRQTSSYQPVEVMKTAAEEKTEEEKAMDMLQSITSVLDEVDMSDPATLESVGGSLLESVGALLEGPEEDAEEKPNDDGFAEDESLSPEERLQKAEEKKLENEAKRRNIVEESRRVLEKMENAMIKTLKPGDPPVSITKGGVTLSAQKILGSEVGGQVVQTEEGGFQLPSQAALFTEFEHAPQSVTVKMKQFEQNPFTWGSGEHQVRSSVVELSLHQDNNEVMTFRNLTEDFIITIPGNPKNKPATKIITIPSVGNRSARYHFYNLTGMAEGFLVTIIPLNASVVYRVSGRRGGRPDDQNYNVSMETYLLPEQCSLTKSLSGDEGDTDKTKATMFIQGEEDPGEYYVKVQVLGPVTECGVENKSDPGDAYDFFAYEIQWARLRCLYWNETLEAWMTDGCAISNQSSINSTVCHCNHLTAFGSDFVTPPNAMDFGKFEFSDQQCGFDNRLFRGVPFLRAHNGPFTSDQGIQEGFCTRQPGDALTFSTAEQLCTVEHENTTSDRYKAHKGRHCTNLLSMLKGDLKRRGLGSPTTEKKLNELRELAVERGEERLNAATGHFHMTVDAEYSG